MPNGDLQDRLFCPTLTLMVDSYMILPQLVSGTVVAVERLQVLHYSVDLISHGFHCGILKPLDGHLLGQNDRNC